MASKVLAILVFTLPNFASAQDSSASVTADLVIQMQQLQDEVRELRGQLEDAQRELENLKGRQHTESTVKTAASRHRIQVRAQDEMRGVCLASVKNSRLVAGRVIRIRQG